MGLDHDDHVCNGFKSRIKHQATARESDVIA